MPMTLFRFASLAALLPLLWSCALPGQVAPVFGEQKIVLMRHGEKPALGLGQLNCQGLNRALALPAVLREKFGKPDFVFASDPHDKKPDDGGVFNYVRPLLTIAPTAIQAGLPIDSSFGFEDIAGLQRELAAPRYAKALVFVAWEHKKIEDLARAMLAANGGDAQQVPHWRGKDFDSLYVVSVRRDASGSSASFRLERQGLDGQNVACPGPAPKP
jgi:hypothetical protein